MRTSWKIDLPSHAPEGFTSTDLRTVGAHTLRWLRADAVQDHDAETVRLCDDVALWHLSQDHS